MFVKGLIWTVFLSFVLSVVAIIADRKKIETDLIYRATAELGELNRKWVSLKAEGRDLTVSGKSPLSALQKAALASIRDTAGVRVVVDDTSVRPKASPYMWTVARNKTGIVLKGHVPSPLLRDDILEKAAMLNAGGQVHDKMELADGAPEEGWSDAINFALAHIDKLKSGTVKIDESVLQIDGEAMDADAYMSILEAFQGGAGAPDGFILVNRVSLPKVSPYRLSARRVGGKVVLEGFAPGVEAREEIGAMFHDAAAGAKIDNRLKLAAGQPDDYDERVSFVTVHMKLLKNGEALVLDDSISISGEALSNGGYDAMMKMPPPAGITLKREIARPLAAPFSWSAVLSADKLVLGGHVPDEISRKTLVEKARGIFMHRDVVDEMEYASGDPEGWGEMAAFLLDNLGRMKTGKAKLTDTKLLLNGVAMDEAALAIINAAKSPSASGLEVNVTAPPPSAVAVEEDTAKVEEGGEAANTENVDKAAEETANSTAPSGFVALDVCQSLLDSALQLKQINFKTASAEIKPESRSTLETLAFTLKKCPEARVEIGGHTDADGDDAMNMELSEKRANSVKVALVALGANPDRLTAVGYGETKPLADNGTPQGRAQNRRIEFIIKQ